MKEFNNLLDTANILLSENGCMWDKKQTLETLKKYLIEEANELAEAIDNKDDENIMEEAGDLFYNIIFICMIAEREKKFTIADVLKNINEKLKRRHPHVFSDVKVNSIEDIKNNWERIKKEEKGLN